LQVGARALGFLLVAGSGALIHATAWIASTTRTGTSFLYHPAICGVIQEFKVRRASIRHNGSSGSQSARHTSPGQRHPARHTNSSGTPRGRPPMAADGDEEPVSPQPVCFTPGRPGFRSPSVQMGRIRLFFLSPGTLRAETTQFPASVGTDRCARAIFFHCGRNIFDPDSILTTPRLAVSGDPVPRM